MTKAMTNTPLPNQVTLRIRVRYAECDAQQVVFNARYADYADLAATEYIRALVGNHQKLLDEGFDNQVVSLQIDWLASAKFDDIIEMQVSVAHIGNTSFRLQTHCYLLEPEVLDAKLLDTKSPDSLRLDNPPSYKKIAIAKMQTTYVVVDSVSFEKRTIPEFLRQAFAKEFNVEVNQAG